MGGLPCGWLINNPDGTPMKEPLHPILAIEQGALRRRPRRDGGGRDGRAGQERGRGGGGRLRRAARRWSAWPMPRRSRAASPSTTRRPTTSATSGRSATRRAVDAAFANAAHVTKLDLVNNRLIPNAIEPRVAIGSYSRANEEYVLYVVEPEPARRAAADDGLRARPARAQGARDRARRRRRLRLQDLPLRRGRLPDLGREAAQPQHQVDRRALRVLPVRRARPRPREPCRDGDGRARQVPGAAGAHRRQPGRLPVDLLDRGADHPLRDPAGRASTPRRRSTSRSTPGSPTPRRSMPTAAPAGPRPPTCWSGWCRAAPGR